jgi:hypothetical protein
MTPEAEEAQEERHQAQELEAAWVRQHERQEARHAAAVAAAQHPTTGPNSGAAGMTPESWVFPILVAVNVLSR